MSELPLNTNLKRSRSANIKNATNIQLHACLDEAKAYKDLVQHHFQESKFQNHVLQSAQRFYKKKSQIRPSSSHSSFTRNMAKRTSSSSKFVKVSSNLQSNIKNPEFNIVSTLDYRANRVSQIKVNFQQGIEQKDNLKRKVEYLKKMIVEEKNLKAKVSIRNCKLMNKSELANHHINSLIQESRRLQIHIKEVLKQNQQLEAQLNELSQKNSNTKMNLNNELRKVQFTSEKVSQDRRELDRQRKMLEMTKQKQTVRYKQMTNRYMVVNQLKQQKALLLNHIDVDLKNNE